MSADIESQLAPTDSELAELKAWAESWAMGGSPVARIALAVLHDRGLLVAQLAQQRYAWDDDRRARQRERDELEAALESVRLQCQQGHAEAKSQRDELEAVRVELSSANATVDELRADLAGANATLGDVRRALAASYRMFDDLDAKHLALRLAAIPVANALPVASWLHWYSVHPGDLSLLRAALEAEAKPQPQPEREQEGRAA